MKTKARTRVKICCISSVAEAQLAIEYGADAVGLVSAMPSGPGVIDDDLIAEIATTIPPGVASFLLTSQQSVERIIAQQKHAGVNTLQLCDSLVDASYAELRAALPGIRLVQVIHVTGEESLAEAQAVATKIDALLLDSGNPNLAVKQLGGTGRQHDWHISRRIRESVSVPVWLAGGLNAGNLAAAQEKVRPFGIDVCSSVRTEGQLDEKKLSMFFQAVAEQ